MAAPAEGQAAGPGGAGPLILKSFHDIPMADLEMIFPEVNITVKFKDMLVNVSLALVALGTFLWTLLSGIRWSREIVTLIGVLAGKVAQSYTALTTAQARYSGLMAKAGRVLRTSIRPTLNLLQLLRPTTRMSIQLEGVML